MDQVTGLKLRRDVTVGPIFPEYAPAMYRWMCDPDVADNLGLRKKPTLERTEEWIEKSVKDTSMTAFAILLKGQHCGNVVIDRIDYHIATGRLSVYVGDPEARGKAVGTTGMYHAIRKFLEAGMHKVYLTVHIRNLQAIRTYERLGFVLEGILRDEFLFRRECLNILYMGLLRSDFERLKVELV